MALSRGDIKFWKIYEGSNLVGTYVFKAVPLKSQLLFGKANFDDNLNKYVLPSSNLVPVTIGYNKFRSMTLNWTHLELVDEMNINASADNGVKGKVEYRMVEIPIPDSLLIVQ